MNTLDVVFFKLVPLAIISRRICMNWMYKFEYVCVDTYTRPSNQINFNDDFFCYYFDRFVHCGGPGSLSGCLHLMGTAEAIGFDNVADYNVISIDQVRRLEYYCMK